MKELTTTERLEIITEMISEAKSSVARGGSNQILLWGWVIALTNLGHFILERVGYYAPYIVWLVVIPAVFVSVYFSIQMKKNGATSHIDRLYGQVWLAIGVSIIVTLMMMNQLDFFHNPIILLEAGIGMYITGQLLRYRPVMYGAFILWIAALIQWQMPIEWHYLISSVAVFIGYLIPGYLLKRSERE
jgi:hypothetical protein